MKRSSSRSRGGIKELIAKSGTMSTDIEGLKEVSTAHSRNLESLEGEIRKMKGTTSPKRLLELTTKVEGLEQTIGNS